MSSGVSYTITITSEDLSGSIGRAGGSGYVPGLTVQPPTIAATGAPTNMVNKSILPYSHFAFNKIVPPRYDGIGKYTAEPVNYPDFISEHHLIALMRCAELFLNPSVKGVIDANTDGGPSPNK